MAAASAARGEGRQHRAWQWRISIARISGMARLGISISNGGSENKLYRNESIISSGVWRNSEINRKRVSSNYASSAASASRHQRIMASSSAGSGAPQLIISAEKRK